MTNPEVQNEVELACGSQSGQGGFGVPQEAAAGGEADRMDDLQNTGDGEVEEPQPSLPVVARAPPCGDHAACSGASCSGASCSCQGVRWMERSLRSMELQLQFLISKADDLHDWLVNGHSHLDREALAAAVPSLLYTCQPYFNHLESSSIVSQHTILPFDVYTRRVQLLDFSQQLCDRLEQLVLTYASYNLLSLDETKPNSVSHFCVGQSRLGPLRVTAFRYCKPTAYLARADTGLYKRMRWNVDRLRDEQQTDDEIEDGDTEFYFLCYEDIPNVHTDEDSQGGSHGSLVRMWSIGQWVQVAPVTDDIYDWIMCEVPQGNYHRLLYLGSVEPSSCCATDYLQQLLLSHQTQE